MQKLIPLFILLILSACGKKQATDAMHIKIVIVEFPRIPYYKLKKEIKMWKMTYPSIIGDFNGDSITETITTKLYSKRDKKMITEVPEDCEMGCMCEYEPVLWLKPDSPDIPPLYLGTHTLQIYGVSKLKNVGDINRDGTDEMAVIVNWADYSSMNTCDIYTLCNGKWKMVFDFRISEHSIQNSGEKDDPNDLTDYFKQKDSVYYYHELQPAGDVWKKRTTFQPCI